MSVFTKFLFELIGTFIMVLMGDGVCASNSLAKSKGKGGGWIVITIGWGFAVMCGVFVAAPYSGAHLNPAVTLGFAISGKFNWAEVPIYVLGQMIGGFLGALAVYLYYKNHYDITEDPDVKLGTFCTMPAIYSRFHNFYCEAFGTLVLVFIILSFSVEGNKPEVGMGDLGVLPVTMLIMSIGMSLGGTTGYALNPARDLGPRFVHYIVPLSGKRDSDWSYGWIPVLAPLTGGSLAGLLFLCVF